MEITVRRGKNCIWSQQVLSAVADLHSRGIVHRDLKPENLLYYDNRAGSVKNIFSKVAFLANEPFCSLCWWLTLVSLSTRTSSQQCPQFVGPPPTLPRKSSLRLSPQELRTCGAVVSSLSSCCAATLPFAR